MSLVCRFLRGWVAVLILISGLSSWAQVVATNFFPIMAWNSPTADVNVLQKMAECGLNVAGFVPPSALDLCHSVGLMAIVSDTRCAGYDWARVDDRIARSNITSLVAQVGKHP